MSKRVEWIKHNGQRLIFIDYEDISSLDEEVALKELDVVHDFVMNAGTNLKILVDVTNAYGSSVIVKKLKSNLKEEKPLIAKEAVIGISGVKAKLLKAVNFFTKMNIKAFDDYDSAKEWLVSNN